MSRDVQEAIDALQGRNVRETILNFTEYRQGWNVRVWREYPPSEDRMTHHLIQAEKQPIHKLILSKLFVEMDELADAILQVDRVNAVEVKLMNGGDGVVFYKDWP